MRDVRGEARPLVVRRQDRRAGHRGRHLPIGPPPARRLDARRSGRRGRGQRVGRLRRGRGLRARASRSAPTGGRCCSATASPTTMPSPLGLTCGGIIDLFVEKVDRATFPQLGEVAEAIAKEQPVAVATVVSRPAGASRTPARRLAGPGRRHHRLGAAGRRGSRRRARPARRGPQRDAALRRRRAAPRRGPRRLRRVVRPAAEDDRVRRDRLRRRRGARSARFLGFRVTVCDARPVFATASRFPGRARGRRRVAAPLPRRGGARRAGSTGARRCAC